MPIIHIVKFHQLSVYVLMFSCNLVYINIIYVQVQHLKVWNKYDLERFLC